MTLQDLLSDGRIQKQEASRDEVQELLRLASRSLKDAGIQALSPEARFNLAYEAALTLARIPLRCSGYRTRGDSHHWSVFHVLPDVMGSDVSEIADYFQLCRGKRSTATYHQASAVSKDEALELIRETEEFDSLVRKWLKSHFPKYA